MNGLEDRGQAAELIKIKQFKKSKTRRFAVPAPKK
jgi:hypothetical protein